MPPQFSSLRRGRLALAALLLLAPLVLPASAAPSRPPAAGQSVPGATMRIVAVVNGDVITNRDVDNRARLFALSANLPLSPDTLNRLKPQILRQLIDEKLRMQAVQKARIVVHDAQIADAIHQIEARNGMPAGALRAKFAADGVSLETLIDQIRTQIGWNEYLREKLGERIKVSPADIAQQKAVLQAQNGQTEFRIGEIFIPIETAASAADTQRFAQTVITELRNGAPFSVVAAEFSQDQSALQGGDLGWVTLNQLDPEVAKVVQEMPAGAVSNPIEVPGGLSIVTLAGKRVLGQEIGTVVSLRQVFLPFTSRLDPNSPTAQQQATLDKARQIGASVHSCDQMTQIAATVHSPRPVDPGPVPLAAINPPAFRQEIATIPYDHTTQPLVSPDGIAVVIVCSREQKNLAQETDEQITNQIIDQRAELLSRQLQRALRREAIVQRFPGAA